MPHADTRKGILLALAMACGGAVSCGSSSSGALDGDAGPDASDAPGDSDAGEWTARAATALYATNASSNQIVLNVFLSDRADFCADLQAGFTPGNSRYVVLLVGAKGTASIPATIPAGTYAMDQMTVLADGTEIDCYAQSFQIVAGSICGVIEVDSIAGSLTLTHDVALGAPADGSFSARFSSTSISGAFAATECTSAMNPATLPCKATP